MTSDPFARQVSVPSFSMSSTDLSDGAFLRPAQMSHLLGASSGQDLSPQLSWSQAPHGTKSFAVTIFDADAPTPSGFWHWAVADIPAKVASLPTGAGTDQGTLLPAPAVQLPNDLGLRQYIGCAPDALSGNHRIFVTVYALDTKHLGVDQNTTPALMTLRMNHHLLARTSLIASTEIGTTTGWGRPPL